MTRARPRRSARIGRRAAWVGVLAAVVLTPCFAAPSPTPSEGPAVVPVSHGDLLRPLERHPAPPRTLKPGSCPQFDSDDLRRGRLPRRDPRCRSAFIAPDVIRKPLRPAAHPRDLRTFGQRAHGRRRHTATDLRCRCGSRVRSVQSGRVVVPRPSAWAGRMVGVTSGPGRLTTWYAHLKSIRVRDGQEVVGGQVLGRAGQSGRPRRCMLHLAVMRHGFRGDTDAVNPTRWLRRKVGEQISGLPPSRAADRRFTVATFNTLGASHVHRWSPYGPPGRRTRLMLRLLETNGVSVAGLQEFQDPQARAFRRIKGRRWGIHSPDGDTRNSIIWRRSRFAVVRRDGVRVPFQGGPRTMPVVWLRDRASGRRTVVMSVHNIHGTSRSVLRVRRVAFLREMRALRRIREATGLPVLVMGDFNDHGRRFYCSMVRRGYVASVGGRPRPRCSPTLTVGIDWIFRTRGLDFDGHQKLRLGLVARASDHPLVLARVQR